MGRDDDVFKSSDYRISPFAVESVLLESPAVAEAAVVPSPDPTRLAVPKAYVVLAEGYHPNAVAARVIFEHSREQLAPYQRIRRLEFGLPKTISGKIRRVELREREQQLHGSDPASRRRQGRAVPSTGSRTSPSSADPRRSKPSARTKSTTSASSVPKPTLSSARRKMIGAVRWVAGSAGCENPSDEVDLAGH